MFSVFLSKLDIRSHKQPNQILIRQINHLRLLPSIKRVLRIRTQHIVKIQTTNPKPHFVKSGLRRERTEHEDVFWVVNHMSRVGAILEQNFTDETLDQDVLLLPVEFCRFVGDVFVQIGHARNLFALLQHLDKFLVKLNVNEVCLLLVELSLVEEDRIGILFLVCFQFFLVELGQLV